MSTDYVDRSIETIGRSQGLELLPHAIRLLSDGRPVAPERLALAAGWTVADVESALAAQGGTECDEDGRLVGLGLTLRPTAHRFIFEGRTVYAWCASDALMVPVILGRAGTAESTCPQTLRPIRIDLAPDRVEKVEPREAVVSALRPRGRVTDVRTAICRHGHFFSSPVAAHQWADEHPEGEVRSVADAFELDRQVVEQLGWIDR